MTANEYNYWFWGFGFGFVFALLCSTFSRHFEESLCQTKNNIADCEWVSVPAIPEAMK